MAEHRLRWIWNRALRSVPIDTSTTARLILELTLLLSVYGLENGGRPCWQGACPEVEQGDVASSITDKQHEQRSCFIMRYLRPIAQEVLM